MYGISPVTIDGNDVKAVAVAAEKVVADARRGSRPALLECLTYRRRSHFEGDPQKYKPADEVEQWEARDPLVLFRQVLADRGEASEAQLDALGSATEVEVKAAFADSTGDTDLSVSDLLASTLTWSREATE